MKILDTCDRDLQYLSESVYEMLDIHSRYMTYITGDNRSRLINDWVSENRSSPCFFLVSDEDKVISFCITDRICKFKSEISLLLTDYYQFNNGYGKRILLHTVEYLSTQDVKNIQLNTTRSNSVACHLYRTLGFEENNETAENITMSLDINKNCK